MISQGGRKLSKCILITIVLASVLLISCANTPALNTEATMQAAQQAEPPESKPTYTTEPTSTPTPEPTDTPTRIPEPTATATATPTPTSAYTSTPETIEEVDLTTRDRYPLAGWLYHSTGPTELPVAVVLAHQLNSSSWEWRSYAELFAQNGFTTLIFDFRGQGHSSGLLDYTSVGVDVEAAIRFLRADGHDQIACMGASMGGSGCLAASIDNDLVGLVNLSGPMNIPGTRLVTDEDLANMAFPKLFMIAEGDTIPDWPTYLSEFVDMYELCPEPKQLVIYPGQAHGVGLLRDEESGEEAVQQLLGFLVTLLPQE